MDGLPVLDPGRLQVVRTVELGEHGDLVAGGGVRRAVELDGSRREVPVALKGHPPPCGGGVVGGDVRAGAAPARRTGDEVGAQPVPAGPRQHACDDDTEQLGGLATRPDGRLVEHVADRRVASGGSLVETEREQRPAPTDEGAPRRPVEDEDVERDVPGLDRDAGPGPADVHAPGVEVHQPRDGRLVVLAALGGAERDVGRELALDRRAEALVVLAEHDHVNVVVPRDPGAAADRAEQGARGEEVGDVEPLTGGGEPAQQVVPDGVRRLEVLRDHLLVEPEQLPGPHGAPSP